MDELNLTTPSLLFSAISLIMLAYTNRFLAYAQLIRNLKAQYQNDQNPITAGQIDNLRKRLYLTRSMQIYGIISLLLCVMSMLFIYLGWTTPAPYIFGVALLSLLISLAVSVQELIISVHALELHLDDMQQKNKDK